MSKVYDVHQYENERTYNNEIPGEGEVIAPFAVTIEQTKMDHMDLNNLKTWRLSGGRKILVAFTVCQEDEFQNMMKIFNLMASDHRNKQEEENLSLDEILENPEEPEEMKKIPENATVPSAEAIALGMNTIGELMERVEDLDPLCGAILSLLAEQFEDTGKVNKGEVLKELGLGKSQGYEKIRRAQALAREVYDDLRH